MYNDGSADQGKKACCGAGCPTHRETALALTEKATCDAASPCYEPKGNYCTTYSCDKAKPDGVGDSSDGGSGSSRGGTPPLAVSPNSVAAPLEWAENILCRGIRSTGFDVGRSDTTTDHEHYAYQI